MSYTPKQEILIRELATEKIQDLQHLLHDKRGSLSDRQREASNRYLKDYQELLYRNRLNRQVGMRSEEWKKKKKEPVQAQIVK
ncbi:Uncharacterised protein [Enterococcus casseliflavus]|uniref:hypothetical protein n=1 Tax=Enterococcus casseliflavus TaxID=37734 RepID=UPI00076B80CE|nr:hypothetical protein [Enterococcus casseliflavus]GEB28476.1 hypothetical protein ECA02_15710 [Enterococcus casseliflavus]STP35144.1 Uncharacterised protein [Enterococcus casseliflavus]